MKTKPSGPFLGINNRLPDFALETDIGRWLREAENVDIDNAGRVRRRHAASLVQSLSAPHSLYTTSGGTRYMVISGAMYTVTLPAYTQTLLKVLSNNNQVSYEEYAGSVYYSNGTDSGRIESGVWYPWALPTPTSPTVAIVTGTLYKGWYQVAVSYHNSTTGEEGGVSPSCNYELATDGGLRITLPAATAGASHINIYVSTVNGSIPLYVSTVATGTASYDYTTPGSVGREANQRYEEPIPAGVPFMHNGRLCTYSGNTICIGLPARPGYYVPTDPRLEFSAPVTNAISGQNGIYVTADKTYWFEGTDILDAQRVVDVLPFGGVAGTVFRIPFTTDVGWFSPMGFILADISGQVSTPMTGSVDLTPTDSGVSSVFSEGGYCRVVSCGWCMNLENKATSQYTDYDFTSISGTYATGDAGVYDLATDGAVDWRIGLGKEDFGTELLKSLPACYVGAASDEPVVLVVTLPGGDEYEYQARSCSDSIEIHRIDPGKGLKENWYGLAFRSERGSSLALATVSFAPATSGRRV